MLSRSVCVALGVLCALGAFHLAWGQVITGSIVGTVTDNTGSVIPGATVTASNVETGAEASAQTGPAGNFNLNFLRAGTYIVTVESAGFQRLQRDNVTVRTTESVRLDLTLQVGMVTETVTVTAETPLLQSEQATLGHVVEEETITSIPLATRNFTQILGTSPGVVGSVMNADQRGTGSDSVSVNGARRGSNNLLVDGVPTTNQLNNAPDGDGTPSIEFLSEFKVLTSLYSAEFGRNSGSVINVTTRSGTNAFHGTVYEFLRNTKLNARPFFFPERQANIQNQYGANIGGPIVRDRTFFFFGWESSRQRNGNGGGARLRTRTPTADERNGIFGDRTLWDPISGSMFPNNTIPASRINPVSQNIQSTFFPQPNLVDPGSNANFEAFQTEPTDLDQYTVRVDHRFTDNSSINGRWFESFQEDLSPFGRGLPSFGNLANREKHTWGITHTYVFSPTFVMETRASGDYTDQFTSGSNTTTPSSVGLQPIPNVTFAGEAAGMPDIRIDDYIRFGNRSNWSDYIDRYTGGNTFTWTKSEHNMKFGWEVQLAKLNPQNNLNSRGDWRFRGRATGQEGAAGDEYAEFLLTLPEVKSFGSSDEFEIGGQLKMKSYLWSFFFADDWKMTPRLTLNWGFRYEVDLQAAAYNLNMVNWWPENYRGLDGTIESTGLVQGGLNGVPNNTVNNDYNNIAPRIGIAWRPTEKWVVRTGGGLYFDARTGQIAQQAFSNPPTFTRVQADCRRGILCDWTQADNWAYLDPGHQSGVVPFPTDPSEERVYRGIARKVLTDNNWQWNLAVQRQLPSNMLFEVSYVGTKGTHLMARRNLNPLVPADGFFGALYEGVELFRQYPGFGDNLITVQNGNATYHSLQSTLKRRMGSSTFQASYTWGKTLGNGDEGSRFFTSIFEVPWNDFSRGKGPANFDRTHRFSFVFNQDLPSRFEGGVGKWLLNDWAVNGFLVAQSGNPLTVVHQDSGANIGGSAQGTSGVSMFADVNSGVDLVSPGSTVDNLDHYINVNAFTAPSPWTFGNSGRGMFRGPGQFNIDFSAFKNIPITERWRMQFRAEFFNLLNHTNFGNPNTSLHSSGFGTIRGTTVNARLVQFALKLMF